MKLLFYSLLLLALSLLPGCGSDDETLNSGEITSDVKSEMEKEKEEVFAAESAHREMQSNQAKGKK
ncbi:hypothetical protein [uncultured Gimesia sp.]|uniref:hypothetical protein n=1 Tax=uncultured Gimesia sp. TaxID=1678688 RepID=UPI0030DA694B|tara:strand:+ start:48796 stop:48993 length:198 start_codon:yes stop_codon:yes gene_type:complete